VLALGCNSYPDTRDHTNGGHAQGWPESVSGPAGEGAGMRVFSGTAALLNNGEACTEEEGAQGDRWCGFVALGTSGARNLFVLNVSQAIAGVPVDCNAPDPNCLLLTENVGGSGADWHPTFFAGDTLVYYDESFAPYVWRPGMTSGRLLVTPESSVDVVFCQPAPRGTAVACLGLPDEQPDETVLVADLYAGAADGESEPLLAPIDHVIAASQADQGVYRFDYGFPGKGYVAWSSRQGVDGLEALKLQRVDDPASQIDVATDVHRWNLSADGTHWFWLSAVDHLGVGTLQTAAFPSGANAIDLVADARDYRINSKSALAALTATGDVVSIPDAVRAPQKQVLVDHAVQVLARLSDQGHIAYGKHLVGTRIIDLFIAKADGAPTCMLDTSVRVPVNSMHFAPGAEAALWAISKDEGFDAFHTKLDDCSTLPLAPDIVALGWIGPETAVFQDNFDYETSSGSLQVRHLGKNGALDPAAPTLIAEHVDSYASLGAALFYTVNAESDQDGVYVRAFAR